MPPNRAGDSAAAKPARCPFAPLIQGAPILGSSLHFLRDTTGLLVGAYRDYGPIFRIRMLWVKFTVLLGFEARDFMAAGGERHLTRHPVFDPVGRQLGASDFALAVSGETHRQLRRLLQIAYSREVANPFVPQFVDAVRGIVREWKPGAVHPVFEGVQELAFEQYCRVMAGVSWRPHYRDCRTVTDMNMKVGGRVRPMWFFKWPPYRAARLRVLQLAADAVARHRQSPPRTAHPTIIQTLMGVRFPDGRPMSDEDIYCYALYGLPGSCSYMGRLVSFMLYEILRRPELKARLIEEVDAAFASGLENAGDVGRLRLLGAVYHETLRFHPVSQGLPYMAAEDFEFHGRRVARRDMVVLSQLPMLFSDPPFKDPFQFDPDRCLEPRNEHRKLGAFNPFGMHHRTCAAMGLVELMALTQVATLLHEVDLELEPADYRLRRTVQPLPAPDGRFRMRARPRVRSAAATPSRRRLREEVFLASFPGAEIPEVAAALDEGRYAEYPPGAEILRQGDQADAFYVLVRGGVEVLQSVAGDPPGRIAVLGPGDYFGEMGLLHGAPRNATVRVLDGAQARVLVYSAEAFARIIAGSDLLSSELARVARKRSTRDQLHGLSATLAPEGALRRLPGFDQRQAGPGARILQEGDPADRFYLLWRGSVEVLRKDDLGVERSLATLGPGAYFGEAGLLHRAPRNATVVVRGTAPATLLTCDPDAFHTLVAESGGVDGDLSQSLANRLSGPS